MDNQEPNKKPMDIVAEQKLERWLGDVGLSDKEGLVTDNRKEGEKEKAVN